MSAIVIKNHLAPTAGRACLASEETGFAVFGSVTLNHPVDGLSPHAVDVAPKMGAKVVWLPTLYAARFLANRSHVKNLSALLSDEAELLYLLEDGSDLKPEVPRIVDLVAAAGAVLDTGHVSIDEARAVVRAAASRGAKTVITHPLACFVDYSLEQMVDILDLGLSIRELRVMTAENPARALGIC
jgi:hypothetical protein